MCVYVVYICGMKYKDTKMEGKKEPVEREKKNKREKRVLANRI